MQTVRDILNNKPKETWSISPKSSVLDALKIMDEKEIGALMVMDEKHKVLGIITERDYARKIILKGKSSKDTKVEEIMTPTEHMFTVSPDATVADCMVLITGKRIRHVPVFDKRRYVGLISIGDMVKSVISEKDLLIDQLSNYIAGSAGA
ncbi:MAG: CBS domain-containing protein [Smithellaceae bacterium]